jgi:hypothetical protein
MILTLPIRHNRERQSDAKKAKTCAVTPSTEVSFNRDAGGRTQSLTYSIVRYSEFRNIPSCRFIALPGADEIKRAALLNSEYSCQSACRQMQKWIAVRLKPRAASGTSICVRGGSCNQERASERIAKAHSRRKDSRRTTRHRPFSPLF